MAEIRSTLDIIMEKTRNLSLTENEKKAFQEKDIKGKVKGLMMKFQEGFFDLDRLKNEINRFKEQDQKIVKQTLIKECADRIDPERDNQQILDVLNHVLGLDTLWIQNLVLEFHRDLENEKKIRNQGLIRQIHAKGISGSAVRPNPAADSEWNQFKTNAREGFSNRCKDNWRVD